MSDDLKDLARTTTAWPFKEAVAILDHQLNGRKPDKGYVLFESGYGPSGLPHIGTFGEVARTTMVRHAFEFLAPEIPTRLFVFSDDRDGLRKIPDNIPNKDLVSKHIGKPLTSIPDPFETHKSFGHHNNAMLCRFLDSFGFEYEFQSATDWYLSSRFDDGCRKILEHYDSIMDVMLPTLGEERQQTYSPFLPICNKTGNVLQVPIIEKDAKTGIIVYKDEDNHFIETPVTNGCVKLQWKADWAMRWYVFNVDYEMSGKDLIHSYQLASRICRIIGGVPPMNFSYELFLDENGQKISKSKGNGFLVEDWLRYAPSESLSLFMYQKPKVAKRLHFDVISRTVDEYLTFIKKFSTETNSQRLNNPVWHIHNGHPPNPETMLSYNILLNLASVCHAENHDVLWSFICRYIPTVTPTNSPFLSKIVDYVVDYYKDFIKPNKQYRLPSSDEKVALKELIFELKHLSSIKADADMIQTAIYEIGKHHKVFLNLHDWFLALYEILLGQNQGPRMGSFIALYGINETIELIEYVLANGDLKIKDMT
ncbi:MAG: lysine--tRNA ligase [Rhodospirillaceae bacterium]|jgi:lysyl-tRNA synthetase class 1|nr:lysine--tRNA ligase [Rhodospirillaceae bacterium]